MDYVTWLFCYIKIVTHDGTVSLNTAMAHLEYVFYATYLASVHPILLIKA